MLVFGTASTPRSLTRIAVPANRGAPGIGRHGDEIKTARGRSQQLHRSTKSIDLGIREVFERCRACFDFDGNDHVSVPDDQVDFATAGPDVASEDGTASLHEKPRRNLLAEVA